MKQFVKQAILHGAEWSGINRFYRWKTRNRLLGLCYHGVISDDAPWDDCRTWIAVSETQFNRQMRELRRHWQPISLSKLDELFQSGRPIPERSVFVTFDDGFRNNLTVAAPILRRYEIPATVFLTTGLIDTENTIWPLELFERILCNDENELPIPRSLGSVPNDVSAKRNYAGRVIEYCKTLPVAECRKIIKDFRRKTEFRLQHHWQKELYEMLEWSEARQLVDRGIEIGAHTVTHCNLAKVSPEEAENELRQSKSTVEKQLNIDCRSMAYPFGHAESFSDDVVKIVRKLGFRIGVTLCLRRNNPEPAPLLLDRLCVTGDLSLESFRSLIAGWRN